MKAIKYEHGELKLSDLEIPRRRGEVLVRVLSVGICNTDLEIVRGYAGFEGILGHEFVGLVEESADPIRVGARVVGEINAGCGRCKLCLKRDPRHCLNRTVLGIHGRHGACAEFLSLPANNLLIVPEEVSDRQAVFTEPLAAACEILEQVTITARDSVAVIGDGKLGQLIARVMTTTGCDPVMIGKYRQKLDLAAAAGIKTTLLDDLDVDPESRFDFVVEASGSPEGLRLALKLVRPRGTIILKSTFHGAVELDTSRIVVDEISIVGSRCGRFEDALKLLASGKIDVEPLIEAEFQLADGIRAFELARRPGALKVLLKT